MLRDCSRALKECCGFGPFPPPSYLAAREVTVQLGSLVRDLILGGHYCRVCGRLGWLSPANYRLLDKVLGQRRSIDRHLVDQ